MINFLTDNTLNSYFFGVTKFFFIICSVLYLIFALIVIKQVSSMSKSVKDKFNTILIIFSYLHLAFSIFLILTTIGL